MPFTPTPEPRTPAPALAPRTELPGVASSPPPIPRTSPTMSLTSPSASAGAACAVPRAVPVTVLMRPVGRPTGGRASVRPVMPLMPRPGSADTEAPPLLSRWAAIAGAMAPMARAAPVTAARRR